MQEKEKRILIVVRTTENGELDIETKIKSMSDMECIFALETAKNQIMNDCIIKDDEIKMSYVG